MFTETPTHLVVDLNIMPSGARYEDQYGEFLKIFEKIATTPPEKFVTVKNPPWSWVPFLRYLRCDCLEPVCYFPIDQTLEKMYGGSDFYLPGRTLIEVLCGMRPELVDALWKCDMQWKTLRAVKHEPEKEFIITTNGAFFRPEVLTYEKILDEYTPKKPNVVLVPCAADKPYPSHLHQLVLDVLPDDSWYLAIVTGVLGIVPYDLWPIMPHYDSGIPNRWRAMSAVSNYFMRHEHKKIAVYSDFYNQAIVLGLADAGIYSEETEVESIWFVVPPQFYNDYLPLHEEKYLDKLKQELNK